MNEIVPVTVLAQALNQHNELALRSNHWIAILYTQAQEQVDLEYLELPVTEAPWRLLTEEEKDLDSIDTLPNDKREWAIEYHELCDAKALDIADGLTEAVKSAMAQIIANRKRKRLRWQKLKYGEIKRVAKETLSMPHGSAGRQIASFIDNHLDLVEEAGVEPSVALEVLSKPDAFSIASSRAISKTEREYEAGEITTEEKHERIRNIMEMAASTDKASNVRRTFINGNKMQIPRDSFTLQDGTVLVTFICQSEHEFSTLDRKTEQISVTYGNTQPILAETQAERSRAQTLQDIRKTIAILQSMPACQKEDFEQYCLSMDILETLIDIGLVDYNEGWYVWE